MFLKPNEGFLTIKIDPPIEISVYLDKKIIGVTPLINYRINIGTYKLSILKDKESLREIEFNIDKNKNKVLLLKFNIDPKEKEIVQKLTIFIEPIHSEIDIKVDINHEKTKVIKNINETINKVISEKPISPSITKKLTIIKTDPPEADVYIDDVFKGKTPLNISLTDNSSYVVKFLKENYENCQILIDLDEEIGKRELDIRLFKKDTSDKIKHIWKFGSDFDIYNIPIIHNNNVYLTTMNNLICLEIQNGEIIWRHLVEKWIDETQPIIFDNRIIFSAGKYLYCLNMINGKTIWKLKFDEDININQNIIEGKIYLNSVNKIYYVDILNGKILFDYEVENDIEISLVSNDNMIFYSLVSNDNMIFYLDSLDYLNCIDYKNKTLIWNYKIDSSLGSNIILYKDKIYFGSNYYFYCLDTNNGDSIWIVENISEFIQKIKIYNDRIFCVSWRGAISIDLNGKILWKCEIDDEIISDLIIYEDKILLISNHYIYCIDQNNGIITWKYFCEKNLLNDLTIKDNRLYFVFYTLSSSSLCCMNFLNCEIKWIYEIDEDILDRPLIVNDKIFLKTKTVDPEYCFINCIKVSDE